VWLADKDDRTLAAALNLVGLATQRNGFPMFGLTYTYDRPREAGEILVVGASPAIDKEVRASAPLKLLEDGVMVPYPVIRGWNNETSSAFSKQQSALGSGRGLLMQFQSPFQAGRSIVMLTASGPDDLLSTSRMLLTGTVQAQSKGDLVLIEPGLIEPQVTSMDAGRRYATGKKGTYSPIESFLYTRPIVYYAAIAFVLLLFAAGLYFGLRKWRAKRRGNA